MQQMQYLLSGMFGRACKSLGSPAGHGNLVEEVGDLRRALTDKLAGAFVSCCVSRSHRRADNNVLFGARRAVSRAMWSCRATCGGCGWSSTSCSRRRALMSPALASRSAGIYATLNEGFPAVLGNLWLGQDEAKVRLLPAGCPR